MTIIDLKKYLMNQARNWFVCYFILPNKTDAFRHLRFYFYCNITNYNKLSYDT